MSLKSYFILLVVSVLFMSCYTVEKPNKPKDLLTEDEMVSILVDMAIMSSAKGTNKKKLEDNGIVPDSYIFERHNIDSIRFNTSSNYYTYDIKVYDDIYLRVKDSLTKLRDFHKAIDAIDKKNKAKKDSINRFKKNKKNDALSKKAILDDSKGLIKNNKR